MAVKNPTPTIPMICDVCEHEQDFSPDRVVNGVAEGYCDKCKQTTNWKQFVGESKETN